MKTNVKKSLAVFAAILTAASAFACCSSESTSTETTSAETTVSAADTAEASEAEVSDDNNQELAFDSGDGSESDPYCISTADQLLLVNNGLTANYKLNADIDLSSLNGKTVIAGYTYEYVDMTTGYMDMSKTFSGVFDENGHTLSNYTYKNDGNQMVVGIFGAVTGTVKKLNVENADISGDTSAMATGGVIGYLLSGKASGANCTGGIVGGSMAAVSNCTAEESEVVVLGDNQFTDGLVQCDVAECGGLIVGGSFTGSLNNCSAKGTVTAEGNEPVGLGGIAGGVAEITFDEGTVSGIDDKGNSIFSHEYEFCGYDETNGFYEYKSTDDNEDEFTYFCLLTDTPASAFHIEFILRTN